MGNTNGILDNALGNLEKARNAEGEKQQELLDSVERLIKGAQSSLDAIDKGAQE